MTTKRIARLIFLGAGMAAAACSNPPGGTQNPPNPATTSAATPPSSSAGAAPAKASDAGEILSVLSVEHQIDVGSQVDGLVLSVMKDEGSLVKAGDVLAQLDDRTLQTELVKARDELLVAQNNTKYKEAELKAKKAAFERQKLLRESGLSSQADLDQAEFEAKGAEYDLHGWEANTESSQAEIRRLEIQIDQMRIHAPFSGVVVRRYIREGENVAKGEKCFRVSQLGPLQVQFQVPESSTRRPEPGMALELALVENPSRILKARVAKISPTVDPASDSYDVTARLIEPDVRDLRPGMAVHVFWLEKPHPAP